jgi:outer membrane protein assembly factor BamB
VRHAGTTISCRFGARIALSIAFLIVFLTPRFQASAQVPAAPVTIPQVTFEPVPRLPEPALPKPQPPPPAGPVFPSASAWSVTIDAGPLVPPLVSDGLVVLALQTGTVSARHLSNGTEAWHLELRVDQPMAADAGLIFAVSGQTLHALSAKHGTPAWTAEIGNATAPVVARGGWVIVASGDGIEALRGSDGARIWKRATGAISERAAIGGSVLYVPIEEGRLVALDLTTGNPLWDRKVGPNPTEPLAYDGRLYLGSAAKQFVCINAESGATEWSWNIGSRTIGAAAADASNVYLVAMDNLVRALRRTNGGQRWTYALVYRPTAGPVVLGDQVAVPGITSELTGLAASTGKPTGKLQLPEKLAVGPAFIPPVPPGGAAGVVSITGGLTTEWILAAWRPAGSSASAPAPVPAPVPALPPAPGGGPP